MTDYSPLKIAGLAVLFFVAIMLGWLPAGAISRRKTKMGRAQAWHDETEHWRVHGSGYRPTDAIRLKVAEDQVTAQNEYYMAYQNAANDPDYMRTVAAQCQAAPERTRAEEIEYARGCQGAVLYGDALPVDTESDLERDRR